MTYSHAAIWTIIIGLGLGTFLIRFSFLGTLGRAQFPGWVMRLLRYTPVAVLPGLVAPLALWPSATGGQTDPARLLAVLTVGTLGYYTKNVIISISGGLAMLYLMLYLLG